MDATAVQGDQAFTFSMVARVLDIDRRTVADMVRTLKIPTRSLGAPLGNWINFDSVILIASTLNIDPQWDRIGRKAM